MTTYDAVIRGAGHNGLILQAYLGKAGLKTLAIERRGVAGGPLSTVEDPRRFLPNTHPFLLPAIPPPPSDPPPPPPPHRPQLIQPPPNLAPVPADGPAP